ncbi:MAG: DUF1501 domain-containing protein [Saprospiraceae bacterium]|nr:DUF1501 domain-containing protein [Saprospiraceae bacterium]MBK7812410.1 DUF1501 domain-containing protein [Saprospiraceae bacterium]MBK9632365.1 DUF1501 domain-containing protein [Saprospiraceae bacterium]
MQNNHNSRRKFLGQLSCAAIGYTTLYNSVLNLKAINALAAATGALDKDYKALVCINLSGGNDSYNMLVPTSTSEYNTYQNVRSNLALSRNELLNLQVRNTPGRTFGLHPAMTGLQNLFNQRKASFISNIGTLIDPLTAQDFYNNNNTIALPLGLFSHSDQSQHWQTGIPQTRTNIGWAGRMSDLIKDMNTEDKISMNLSLSGTNILETGNEVIEYVIDPREGSIGIRDYRPDNMYDQFNIAKTQAIDSMLGQQYHDAFEKTYMDVIRNGRDGHLKFKGALDQGPVINTQFSDNYLSDSMKMIARTISVHEELGFKRQVFYVDFYGWDHHDEVLNNQNGMLSDVSAAVSEFHQAMEQLGLSDQVTTFCISEFGRTLTSNGNGTDHAWGGNVFVAGGAVNGGNIFGQYPDLALNGPLNIYEGTVIPTTPVDTYFAELALWMGVRKSDLNFVIPNIGNFYNVQSSNAPIGFLKL